MRAFAKAFYESPAWRKTRAYILKRDAGLCVRCGAPGVIVHHKRELTPQNIDDPMISLNADNLETLCRACHAIAHGAKPPLAEKEPARKPNCMACAKRSALAEAMCIPARWE